MDVTGDHLTVRYSSMTCGKPDAWYPAHAKPKAWEDPLVIGGDGERLFLCSFNPLKGWVNILGASVSLHFWTPLPVEKYAVASQRPVVSDELLVIYRRGAVLLGTYENHNNHDCFRQYNTTLHNVDTWSLIPTLPQPVKPRQQNPVVHPAARRRRAINRAAILFMIASCSIAVGAVGAAVIR